MRTIRTKVYKFSELSKSAKETAIENYRNNGFQPAWLEENSESMKAFADLFPIKITNWSYGGRGEGVDFHFTSEDTIEELSGQRLATYIWNNYRNEIYTKKYYSICDGHKNCVGLNSKHRESKIELDEFGCPFTGYYMDNEITAQLFDFMRKPDNRDFKDLLGDCFDAWIKACNKDIEFQNSDNEIADHIEANEYEFTNDGELFHK